MFEDPQELRSRLIEITSSDDEDDPDRKRDKERWKEEKKLTMTEVAYDKNKLTTNHWKSVLIFNGFFFETSSWVQC